MNSKSNKIDKCKWWTQITCVINVAIYCPLPKSHAVRNIKCLRASDSIIFITKGWLWVEGIRKIKNSHQRFTFLDCRKGHVNSPINEDQKQIHIIC